MAYIACEKIYLIVQEGDGQINYLYQRLQI